LAFTLLVGSWLELSPVAEWQRLLGGVLADIRKVGWIWEGFSSATAPAWAQMSTRQFQNASGMARDAPATEPAEALLFAMKILWSTARY
jgi:hypothetical protein